MVLLLPSLRGLREGYVRNQDGYTLVAAGTPDQLQAAIDNDAVTNLY